MSARTHCHRCVLLVGAVVFILAIVQACGAVPADVVPNIASRLELLDGRGDDDEEEDEELDDCENNRADLSFERTRCLLEILNGSVGRHEG